MAEIKLDRMKQIDNLREVWRDEALDFTPWLAKAENMAILSDEIGIDLEDIRTESAVGQFSVDIIASEQGTGETVIIENQLEQTNHDHLGKLITYASGCDAKIIIWVVKRARDEHRAAVEWLNQHTEIAVSFFLVEIQLFQIGNSALAPKFNIIERPNEWQRQEKADSDDGLTENAKLALRFWNTFKESAMENDDFRANFREPKVNAKSPWWQMLFLGRSYRIDLVNIVEDKSMYVRMWAQNDENKAIYDGFYANKDDVEAACSGMLVWDRKEGKRLHPFK